MSYAIMRQLMPVPEKRGKPTLPADVQQIFVDVGKQFPNDFSKQAHHIVAAHRPARVPRTVDPLNMGLSDWERIRRERERQRQEAEARERARQQQEEQQRRARERAEQQQRELINKQGEELGEKICDQLAQDLRNQQIDLIAENIARSWRLQAPDVPISLTTVRDPRVWLNNDGTVRENNSQVGRKVSYSHEDVVSELQDYEPGVWGGYYADAKGTVQKELNFGIGYVSDYNVISEARGHVTQSRVKAYYVGDHIRSKAVPVHYPGAMQKFHELLDEQVEKLSPEKVIPEAALRVQPYKKDPPKKGFWKRIKDFLDN